MSHDRLIAYEKEFDSLVKDLPIWEVPVRPILTALHVAVDCLFHGSRRDGSLQPRPEAGAALGARLSYLVPYLMKCDSEPTGLDAADALRAVNEADPQGLNRYALLTYGHFCELMPEVHRGYYVADGDKDGGFTLSHSTPQFAVHEASDIILTELSLTFVESPAPRLVDRFDRQASMAPKFDLGVKFHTIKQFYEHYRTHLSEPPILTDEGYRAALGVRRDEFERFRAGLFAYADYCRGMADAFERRIRREGYRDELWNELIEWVSVNWKETFFLGVLQGMTELGADAIDRLIALFTVDFRSGKKAGRHAGDGFLPPLARLEQSFLFNPDLLRLFLPARNILYTLNRTDRKRYDDLVSQYLEPELLSAAESLFLQFEGIEVVKNYRWSSGEFDLLVYSPAENAGLHLQAKAAIPPQGARMVQAVEGRMLEGIDQLRQFRELTSEARDEILSAALKRDVHGVRVTDVLLTRSCFGTETVWSKLGDVTALNLPLLRLATKKALGLGRSLSIAGFSQLVSEETGAVLSAAAPRFEAREVPMGTTVVRLPLLEYDTKAVWSAQRRAWEDR